MSLAAVHPTYADAGLDWTIVRDVYKGERQVKSKTVEYLPPTQAMHLDGMAEGQLGLKSYRAYLLRSVWHDLYKDAVQAYIGMLWSKPPTISLPDSMKNIRSNMGETIEQLLRRINFEQLVSGRLGLLADLPAVPTVDGLPYLAMYKAEHVRNWDTNEDESNNVQINYVILDESGYKKSDDFTWQKETRYRLVTRGVLGSEVNDGLYYTGLFRVTGGDPSYDQEQMKTPVYRGTPLTGIPFAFINAQDNMPEIDEPPLLGLANSMLAMFRSEADYRQNLFMQGQDTLVTIGGVKTQDALGVEAPLRTGTGARIDMEAQGDAKYIGVSGSGLPEQRTALENDRARAELRAGQMINARVGDKESGEALKTRLGAQTATLTSIALSGAAGLQKVLRDVARWMGEDPAKVVVTPNEEFTSTWVTGQDLFQLMEAKNLGLPISYASIHAYCVDRGVTRNSFVDEVAQISSEQEMAEQLMNKIQLELERKKAEKPAPGPRQNSPTNNKSGKN